MVRRAKVTISCPASARERTSRFDNHARIFGGYPNRLLVLVLWVIRTTCRHMSIDICGTFIRNKHAGIANELVHGRKRAKFKKRVGL